jgi:hypothetical protein
MASWPPPQRPEDITEEEWQVYLNSDLRSMNQVFREKVEAALGWKKDDVADAREIAEKVLGAVSLAEAKGHVPEENLGRYRRLMQISRQLDSLGNQVSGRGQYADANVLWEMASKYRNKAQELRVDIPREEG